jgi:hypothetical protein
MGKAYKPKTPFNVPCLLLKCTLEKVNGVNQPTFAEDMTFFCSAKSYGGTEKIVNNLSVIEDTWYIDAWYNPRIAKGDHIRFLDDNSEYEILATPENIERKGVWMRFKVRHIGG